MAFPAPVMLSTAATRVKEESLFRPERSRLEPADAPLMQTKDPWKSEKFVGFVLVDRSADKRPGADKVSSDSGLSSI